MMTSSSSLVSQPFAACRHMSAMPEKSSEATSSSVRHGSCACGSVQYKMIGEPMVTHACHCRDCQKLTGSAFVMNAWTERDNLKIEPGSILEKPSAIKSNSRIVATDHQLSIGRESTTASSIDQLPFDPNDRMCNAVSNSDHNGMDIQLQMSPLSSISKVSSISVKCFNDRL